MYIFLFHNKKVQRISLIKREKKKKGKHKESRMSSYISMIFSDFCLDVDMFFNIYIQ